MKFSIVTPNRNGARYLETAIRSVLAQREAGLDLEYIVVDGGSTDGSRAILDRYRADIAHWIREPDRGPADAINKGLARATGDVLAWLNADDYYFPGALRRAAATMERQPRKALCFGRCRIVDASGNEIRRGITHFKQAFFPISGRWTIQTVNYVSQPAMVFRRSAFERAGPLRTDLIAAWDYDLLLRLWRLGGAVPVPGAPLAAFRRHDRSISERHFRRQFQEELDVAAADAGRFAPQTLLHRAVRAGIVGIYSWMDRRRRHAHRD